METVGRIAKGIILAALCVLALFVVVKYSYSFGVSVFYQQAEEEPGTDVVFEVDAGDDVKAVAEKLEDKGLIKDAAAFRIQCIFYKLEPSEGEYALNTSMTSKKIIEVLQEVSGTED